MSDSIYFDVGQGIEAGSGRWYKNIQLLGVGGNAVTVLVLANDGPHRGVPFALKVFRKVTDAKRRKRFLDEVQFLEGCDHPSVMRVYDSGVFETSAGEYPFVVAEYLPRTLRDVIRANEASTTEKLSYALQLLSGLQYLTTLDPPVIHRDIKPENIFVKGRSCVIGDFGLHKLEVEDERDTDLDVYYADKKAPIPFFYRSPDLVAYAKGESGLTTKSDVFQLGLVLTELFTGWNPAKRPTDVLDPVELEGIRNIPGNLVSAGIASLLRRMLAEDPDARPSASSLMDGWSGAFASAIEHAHELDGRAL